ncbi:hypothetical protein MKX01_012227 [Papaver californicum]|nr:hypothetical protein MKX01_012227 [Papaver californicum]
MATGIACRVALGQSLSAESTMRRRNVCGLMEISFLWFFLKFKRHNAPKLSSEWGIIVRGLGKFIVDTTMPFKRKYLNENMVKSLQIIGMNWLSILRLQKRSQAGSNNREKVLYNHCGRSLPFVAQKVQLAYIQTFYDTHIHVVKTSDGEDEVQLYENIQSQEDLILKYQDEIKEIKDGNQKMKNDNVIFKLDMLN